MEPRTPGPASRRPFDSGGGQDIIRALASLERRFPAAVIWFGLATGHWWAVATADHGSQLVEAESPGALTVALARLGIADPSPPGSGGPALTRPQAVLRADLVPPGTPSAPSRPRDGIAGGSPSP